MLRLILTLFLLCATITFVRANREYEDQTTYQKDFPLGKLDGTDGNWLRADRKCHNHIWNRANETNLVKKNGFENYHNITERADFYKWFQLTIDSLGFETKWAGIASVTTHKLNKLLGPLPKLTGNTNNEIKAFVVYGNQLIFDDIWSELQKLRLGKVLKDTAAKNWDEMLLLKEQKLINPSYLSLSQRSIRILEKSLRKENLLSKFFPGLEFEGDLLSIQDRWVYGMRMMGYKTD